MKRDAHLPVIGHRLSTLAIAAMLACFMAFGVSDAFASATSAGSPTRAQKLTKALKACKKQPKRKRAACVRHAKKKYGPVHPGTPPATGVTPPAAGTTPAPVTPPTPGAGPVPPAGPTLAQIQQQLCEHHCDATHQISNVTILERGVPRLGTGIDTTRGGDGVPSDTWIFPLVVGYDEGVQKTHYAPCPPAEPFCVEQPVTETVTTHWTEQEKAQLANNSVWAFFFVSSSAT